MPTFVYRGIPEETREMLVGNMIDDIKRNFGQGYPEKRGENKMYHDTKADEPWDRDQKKKRRVEYRAKREKELRASLKANDAEMTVFGVTFPKGEPVFVPEDHKLMIVSEKAKAVRGGCKAEELVKAGRLEVVPEPKEEPKEEPKADPMVKPKAKK